MWELSDRKFLQKIKKTTITHRILGSLSKKPKKKPNQHAKSSRQIEIIIYKIAPLINRPMMRGIFDSIRNGTNTMRTNYFFSDQKIAKIRRIRKRSDHHL